MQAATIEKEQSINVIERQKGHDAGARGLIQKPVSGALHDVRHEIMMSQHNCLWKTRGATGAGQGKQVLLWLECHVVWEVSCVVVQK